MKKIFMLFFILTFFVSLFSEQLVEIVAEQEFIYFNNFYPANFNPDDPNSQPVFFTVHFNQIAPEPVVDFVIRVDVEVNGTPAWVELTSNPSSPIIEGSTFYLTNRDVISNSHVEFDYNGDYDALLNQIDDYVLETGRMPDGMYLFSFFVENMNGDVISNIENVTVEIQSPISISLITPGYPLGSFGPMSTMNQYPEFIWFSNLTEYTFDLYHIDENVTSAEDVEKLDKYYTETTNANSILYPSSALTLEDGQIYAWRVSAPLLSPGSAETYKSVFYSFQINLEEEEEEQIAEVMVTNFLNQLNTDDVTVLQNLLNSGYNISTIMWQGEEISVDELMDILNKIANGELEVLQ